MDKLPDHRADPTGLRFLKILVTVLTLSMIIGVVTLIALFVIRLPGGEPPLPLPAVITLPDGVRAEAFTQGGDWYAVVTTDGRILVFNRDDGMLRQEIVIQNR